MTQARCPNLEPHGLHGWRNGDGAGGATDYYVCQGVFVAHEYTAHPSVVGEIPNCDECRLPRDHQTHQYFNIGKE